MLNSDFSFRFKLFKSFSNTYNVYFENNLTTTGGMYYVCKCLWSIWFCICSRKKNNAKI